MLNDVEFVEKTNKFMNMPYALGDKTKGFDCLNMMMEFFDSAGIPFPKQFRDWTIENYPERWARGEGMDVFRDFLFSIGQPVEREFILPGDIIILEKAGVVSAGLYLGNGIFQAAHNKQGIIRLPIKFFVDAITGIRRLR